jgi:hypothetical protein
MKFLLLSLVLTCSRFVQIDRLHDGDHFKAVAYCKYTPTPEDVKWSKTFKTEDEMKSFLKENSSKIRLKIYKSCICSE